MKVILAHDHFDAEHLDAVKAEMATMGAPTIRAYQVDDDTYQAIEGCHRLRACEALGLIPEMVILDAETRIVDDTGSMIIDYDGCAIETIGEIGNADNYSIDF